MKTFYSSRLRKHYKAESAPLSEWYIELAEIYLTDIPRPEGEYEVISAEWHITLIHRPCPNSWFHFDIRDLKSKR